MMQLWIWYIILHHPTECINILYYNIDIIISSYIDMNIFIALIWKYCNLPYQYMMILQYQYIIFIMHYEYINAFCWMMHNLRYCNILSSLDGIALFNIKYIYIYIYIHTTDIIFTNASYAIHIINRNILKFSIFFLINNCYYPLIWYYWSNSNEF